REGKSDQKPETRYYNSADQLRADLERLQPGYMFPLELPELSVVVGPASIQLANEHVGLTSELMQVVNHPVFRRLDDISQLEYAKHIYPGASHSRHEHSLSS